MSDNSESFKIDLEDFDLGSIDGQIEQDHSSHSRQDTSFIRNIPINLTLEVASTELIISDLLDINLGAVIELDKLSGEPMDVRVNGALLGHAEVVIVNGKYGLRLTEIVDDKDMVKRLYK